MSKTKLPKSITTKIDTLIKAYGLDKITRENRRYKSFSGEAIKKLKGEKFCMENGVVDNKIYTVPTSEGNVVNHKKRLEKIYIESIPKGEAYAFEQFSVYISKFIK